ncbi:hypothetical protein DFP72DRAFT_847799 [Ephemerocybe angulata]|uniref:Uncharacterized protein n=1 Tax=Ephemerocybe angulata TaxID=980116 RepID=A0A8H6M8P0_9AGAR|nr:hypothetical protein DFP72DRAFT_847799 [Tulosesus angulatus]
MVQRIKARAKRSRGRIREHHYHREEEPRGPARERSESAPHSPPQNARRANRAWTKKAGGGMVCREGGAAGGGSKRVHQYRSTGSPPITGKENALKTGDTRSSNPPATPIDRSDFLQKCRSLRPAGVNPDPSSIA